MVVSLRGYLIYRLLFIAPVLWAISGCNGIAPSKILKAKRALVNDLIPDSIYKLDHDDHNSYFPVSFNHDSIIAEIINPSNFTDSAVSFNISKAADVKVFAVGELNNSLIDGSVTKYIPFDRAELYFDLKNDRSRIFRSNDDDRQFILSYGNPNVEGLNYVTKGVNFTQKDPAINEYVFDITIPWKSLGYVTPIKNSKIGFNIRIIDNDYPDERLNIDYKYRPIAANLFNKNVNVFDPSTYGTIILTDTGVEKGKNTLTAKKMPEKRNNKSDLWTSAVSYPINNIVKGRLRGKNDFAATVKCLWDNSVLRFRIEVMDNFKMNYNGLVDYGSIVDAKGHVVWTMTSTTSKYAGGASKNQKLASSVFLKKGSYKLHYISDESHAFGHWNDKPPTTPFYGILIYR